MSKSYYKLLISTYCKNLMRNIVGMTGSILSYQINILNAFQQRDRFWRY